MHLSSLAHLARRAVVACAATVAVIALSAPLAEARQSDLAAAKKAAEIVEFTVDVAEDLNGKFVPTLVRPEDTQPERGSFYVTQGRVFPAGTIEGDGADFDPNRSGHVGIWISRGTHLVAASEIPQAETWWVHTAQLYILGRQGKEQIATEGVEGIGTCLTHSERRHRQLRRLGGRTASDLPRVQRHGRRQSAGDVRAAEGWTLRSVTPARRVIRVPSRSVFRARTHRRCPCARCFQGAGQGADGRTRSS